MNKKEQQIIMQHEALGHPAQCRITATHAIAGYARNLCKIKDVELERFWTLEDILHNIPQLSKLNAQGWNIYTTPIEEGNRQIHILIDDIRPSFFETGYQPNLLMHSSPNSQQAVFVLPYIFPRQIYLSAFNQINKLHGDPQISGLRHPFRLCGFTNRKPKYVGQYGYPYVQIDHCSFDTCPILLEFIEQIATITPTTLGPKQINSSVALKPEDKAMGRDFHLAKKLISQGKTGSLLRQEFQDKSEHLQDVDLGISGYDTDTERYTNRTLENAQKIIKNNKK